MIEIEVWSETLTRTIIEIIVHWVKTAIRIIVLAQILHALRFTDRVILARHMVRHEVDNHLQSCLMRTLHQLLKLLHTLIDIYCQIRIYVVIVGDGIGGTSLSFHDSSMLTRNTISTIVCRRGMTDDTCIPDMTHAHTCDFFQYFLREISHLATAVLGNRTILYPRRIPIAVEPCKHLVYNYLLHLPPFILHSYSIPCADTSLLILAIIPCKALPGPHSVKSSAPSAIIFCTHWVQRTLEVS